MMIQFNLLPDVKLEYIKARRAKRFVMLIATLVTAVAVTLLILLFMVVNVFQKRHLNNLTADIKRDSSIIQETPDIEKILTIQSQLQSLPALHDQKPVASRLFTYIKQMTPTTVSISKIEVDFAATTIKITGKSPSTPNRNDPLPASNVNKFVDTLKFTDYQVGETKERAFSEVVLTTIDIDGTGANYVIDFKFNPAIFSSAGSVKLVIPNIITTRSQTERPGQDTADQAPLFEEPTESDEDGTE